MKIKKVLMGVALAAMCLMSAQAQRRNADSSSQSEWVHYFKM